MTTDLHTGAVVQLGNTTSGMIAGPSLVIEAARQSSFSGRLGCSQFWLVCMCYKVLKAFEERWGSAGDLRVDDTGRHANLVIGLENIAHGSCNFVAFRITEGDAQTQRVSSTNEQNSEVRVCV